MIFGTHSGRDLGYFRIFLPLMIVVLGWLAFSSTTYQGLLSALSNFFLFLPACAAYFASGCYWNPTSVFHHACDNPRAQGATFFADIRRLVRHRAIYPVVLINLLWNFSPGSYTPMQFYLTSQLHAPDSTYGYFLGTLNLCFVPPVVLNGLLCQKFPPRKLLLWSVIIGVPQFLPMGVHQQRAGGSSRRGAQGDWQGSGDIGR